jgi:hypothetical protein
MRASAPEACAPSRSSPRASPAHHLEETEGKDGALRLGALDRGVFFAAQPDTPAKLAGFAYAVENLEIVAYELLLRVAVA